MPSVFVSYSRKDQEFVARLTHDLEMRQANVWWDRELAPGERFVDMITRRVSQADFVIAVHSEHSSASRWVALEMGAVLARELQKSDVLQLVAVDVSDLPQWIGDRNAVPMYDQNYSNGLRRLCESMGIQYDLDEKSINSGRLDEHLKVFRAGQQWMELLIGDEGLECILVNGDEQVARVQWTMDSAALQDVRNNPSRVSVQAPYGSRPWGTFGIGSFTSWRWSPQLLDLDDPEEARDRFEEKLRAFLGV